MLRWAPSLGALRRGVAEGFPSAMRSFDLLSAAGSLNYRGASNRFFSEAIRVLMPGGVLLVYDFSPRRTFRDTDGLDEWFDALHRRYPPPAAEGRELNPEILGRIGRGFRLDRMNRSKSGSPSRPNSTLDYALTETNVASAVRRGTPEAEIRRWSAETLASLWKGAPREVLFRGYFACLTAD